MDVKIYERYKIRISGGEIASIEIAGQIIPKFPSPASKNKRPKLYVIVSGIKIIYVGITSQSLRARLRWGFKAKGEQGYYGYKWKDLSEVEMLVWYFPGSQLSSVEAIEAEMVYLVRLHTDAWPKYQMEIHFHQSSVEDKKLAEAIYSECVKH